MQSRAIQGAMGVRYGMKCIADNRAEYLVGGDLDKPEALDGGALLGQRRSTFPVGPFFSKSAFVVACLRRDAAAEKLPLRAQCDAVGKGPARDLHASSLVFRSRVISKLGAK
jgi:hypothetical protein